MPTQIVQGFSLNAAEPIDKRMVTKGLADRNNLQYKYEGLRVYDTLDKKAYVWLDGQWQQEGSAGAGGSNISGITGNIPKFNETGLTNSVIKEYLNGSNLNIGIGACLASKTICHQLEVGGTVKANAFIGTINGGDITSGTITNDKIAEPIDGTKNYVLKAGKDYTGTQWVEDATSAACVSVQNNTTPTLAYPVWVSAPGSGAQLYSNCNTPSKAIALNAASSQLLASSATSNNNAAPGYSFIGSQNTGLYGSSTEVGISFAGKKRVFAQDGLVQVIPDGTTSAIKVSATGATLSVSTWIAGSSTFTVGTGASTLGGTLTVAGISTLNNNLIVASGKTTTLGGNTSITGASTFTVGTGASTLGGTLTVTGASTLGGTLTVTGTSTLNNTLTVAANQATSLGGTLTVTSGNATSLGGTLTVAGDSTLNGNLIVASGKTITLYGTTIKALSNTNEFNFINDSGYNNDLYLNYRGASSVNSYIFWNGKASSGGTYAPIYTGGSYNNGPVNIGLNGTIIQRVVVGSVNVAQDGTHAINKGSNFVVMGSGSTSGNAPVAVINLKNAMPNTNYSIFVSFSNSVNAYQWVCVSEVVNTSTFKISVARTNASSWSGVLEVSFMLVCYSN